MCYYGGSKEMKYKVGDKVLITSDVKKIVGGGAEKRKWAGATMTIKEVYPDYYDMIEDAEENGGQGWSWTDEMIERKVDMIPFNKNTVYELRDGDECVILDKNGQDTLYSKNQIGRIGGMSALSDYDANGLDVDGDEGYDIMAYKTFDCQSEAIGALIDKTPLEWDWQREEPVEMTVEEICKALGKTVKIIK